MSDRPDYGAVVTALFRRVYRDRPTQDALDQERLVGTVRQALRARRRRRSAVRWTLTSVAAAGSLAAAISLITVNKQKPAVVSAVASAPQSAGPRLLSAGGAGVDAGTRLVSPLSGEVQVGSSDGTSLTLERGSEIRVTEATATQRFGLAHGALRAHVARLGAGQRFIVNTDDAEVEVHGTRFRVAIVAPDPGCGGGTRTRVFVDEGIVSVHTSAADALVHPGEQWPAGCPTHERDPREPREQIMAHPRGPRAPARSVRETPPALPPTAMAKADVMVAAPPVSSSELAAQNDLFAAGLRAKRSGDTGAALRNFELLLSRYPGSALAEGALAQRMNLLSADDPPTAARAASDYLARFPDGFAAIAAKRLASTSAP